MVVNGYGFSLIHLSLAYQSRFLTVYRYHLNKFNLTLVWMVPRENTQFDVRHRDLLHTLRNYVTNHRHLNIKNSSE